MECGLNVSVTICCAIYKSSALSFLLACIKQKSSTLSLFPITFLACMYEEIYLAVHVVVVVV